MSDYPLIQDCVLTINGDTVAFEVTGNAIIVNCLTDAATTVEVNAASTAYVMGDEGNTYSGAGTIEPLASDRGVWNALDYSARHANDIDNAAGVHHTLGTGAAQAAAGDHAHAGMGTVTSIATGTGLTGGPITTTGTISDANTGVAAATYGDATHVGQFAVNAQGRITSASDVAIVAGHAIQDEGVALTSRGNLNFTGAAVTATDDAGNNATVVAIQTPAISVYNETQIATGGATAYLMNIAVANTVRVYVNGIRQPVEDTDSDSDEVTFSSAPALDDTLIFDYELSLV